jgi:hypothetical protein
MVERIRLDQADESTQGKGNLHNNANAGLCQIFNENLRIIASG